MTKKKFLSELEKKLSVLNESEIKDIMNEYNDIRIILILRQV